MRELPLVQGRNFKRPRPSFKACRGHGQGAFYKLGFTAHVQPLRAGYAVCAARRSPLQSNTKAGGTLIGTNLRRTCEKRAFSIGRMMLEY